MDSESALGEDRALLGWLVSSGVRAVCLGSILEHFDDLGLVYVHIQWLKCVFILMYFF